MKAAENLLLLKRLFPFLFTEADQHKIVIKQDRPLHQHAVLRKKIEHFIFGHRFQTVFQIQLPVLLPGRVEEPCQRKAALFLEGLKLFPGRVVAGDIPFCHFNTVGRKPLFGFGTGRALCVAQNCFHI